MRFLLLIHDRTDPAAPPGPPPPALETALGELRADTSRVRWVDDGGLAAPDETVWVRTASGATSVVDGPFTEAKEVVGGFFLLEADDPADVRAWVERFVGLHAEHWPGLAYDAELRRIATDAG